MRVRSTLQPTESILGHPDTSTSCSLEKSRSPLSCTPSTFELPLASLTLKHSLASNRVHDARETRRRLGICLRAKFTPLPRSILQRLKSKYFNLTRGLQGHDEARPRLLQMCVGRTPPYVLVSIVDAIWCCCKVQSSRFGWSALQIWMVTPMSRIRASSSNLR